MIINLDSSYIKAYRKRIRNTPKLVKKVTERVKLFVADPRNLIIKDHRLTGNKKDLRAFWVTGDIRIVYFPISKNEVLFLDIGTHNQVY